MRAVTRSFAFFISLCLLGVAPESALSQCPIDVDAGEDIYLCAPPTPTQLNGNIDGDYMTFNWTPTSGMTGANTLNPTVNVSTTTNYVLTVNAPNYNNNLIINGDFESGSSGFSSDYIESPGNLVPEGVYEVLTDPSASHPNFAACPDHTSGSGNMMAVNGAGTPGTNVWCQSIAVMPNTQYVFSAWVTSLISTSPAILQFSINGVPLGNNFNAPSTTCQWVNFFSTWNSGSNSSIDICIVNQNTVLSGNDFALDDLVFAPVCTEKDTVTVHVVNVTAVANPTVYFIPCDGASVTLSGAGSSAGPDITYQWETVDGNIVSGANTLAPVVNAAGAYVLTVTFEKDGFVCEKMATVNVVANPNPISAWITPPNPLGCGSATTILFGNSNQGGQSTWEWSTLNGNIVSGADAKNCTVDKPGLYTLVVTNVITGCSATADVTVTTANNPPTANAGTNGPITCIQTTAVLSGAGSSTGANMNYAWTTTNGQIQSGQSSQNAVASAPGTYILAVTNTSNNCTTKDTVTVVADTLDPTVLIAPPGVLDCDTDTLSLSATVSPAGANLNWTASMGGVIVSGQTSSAPEVISTGVYTLQATNSSNGCSTTASATVNSNYTPPTALVAPADSITCQQSSVTLSGAGSSTGTNFSYVWTASPGGNIVSGDNTLNPLVNASANYTLTVLNTLNACTATASVFVAADTNIVLAVANAPDSLTCAVDTVTLNSTGSSSGAGMAYAWSTSNGNIAGPTNVPNPVATQPGVYQLILTNTVNGCSATDIAVVAQNLVPPSAQIAPPDTLTCAQTQITVTATNSAVGQFAYVWTTSGGNIVSGDSTLTPVIGAAGTYTLQTTNLVTGCTSVSTVNVAQQAGLPTAIAATPGVLNCKDTLLTLSGTGSTTGTGINYSWTTAGGNITGGAGGLNPTVDQPGVYTLSVVNTLNGCSTTASVTVLEDVAEPVLSATQPGVLTCTAPSQTLNAQNASPGNFTYQWTTAGGNIISGAGGLSPLVDSAGVYTLTAQNLDNFCKNILNITVSANQTGPALQAGTPETLTCSDTSILLPANQTNAVSTVYNWTPPAAGAILSGQNTLTPLVQYGGVYSLLATNPTNGCTATLNLVVPVDTAAPKLSAAAPFNLTCLFNSQNLQANNASTGGPFVYTWTTSNGHIISGATTLTPTIDSGGLYNLVALNTQNGCTSSLQLDVPENFEPPTVSAGPNDTLSCAVSNLTLNGSGSGHGPVGYAWSAAQGGLIVSGIDSPNPVIAKPGLYTLTVTNSANGCTASASVQIFKDDQAPAVDAGTAPVLNCQLTQAQLQAQGNTGPGFTYLWSTAGGNIFQGGNTPNPVVDAPGIYTVTITNEANGCTAFDNIEVKENVTTPGIQITIPAKLTCTVLSVPLAASLSGGINFSYSWSGPGLQSTSVSPSATQSGLFSLTVTNTDNFCTATANTQVLVDSLPPLPSAAAPETLTCVQKTVTLAGSVGQAPGGFTAQWSTPDGHIVSGAQGLNPVVDKPGNYQLIAVSQQNGCTATFAVVVPQDTAAPVAVAATSGVLTCKITQLTLSGAGSSVGTPYTYFWSAQNGGILLSGTNSLQPLAGAAGLYRLTVKNEQNGCTQTAQTAVQIDTLKPGLVIVAPGLLTCIVKEINLQGQLNPPLSGFSAGWSTSGGQILSGQNGLNPKVGAPGVYTLQVENLQNGCTTVKNTTVQQDIAAPAVEAGPAGVLHCNQLSLKLQGGSTTAGTAFLWQTQNGHIISGGATAQATIDKAGVYQLVVTKTATGCTAVDQTSVSEVPPPQFSFIADQPDCKQPLGSLEFGAVNGGQPPFLYSINGGATYGSNTIFGGLKPSTYSLSVEDAYGCTADTTIALQPPVYPQLVLQDIYVIDLGDSIQLIPQVNFQPQTALSWQWSPAEGLSCADCQEPFANTYFSKQYSLTVTDKDGCTASDRTQVRVQKDRNIYAPNVFSPDGDGKNDRFNLFGKRVAEVRNLAVFDRWGNQVYFTASVALNDETQGWDGSFRGKLQNPAVFVWTAEAIFLDGEEVLLKGDVTLVR